MHPSLCSTEPVSIKKCSVMLDNRKSKDKDNLACSSNRKLVASETKLNAHTGPSRSGNHRVANILRKPNITALHRKVQNNSTLDTTEKLNEAETQKHFPLIMKVKGDMEAMIEIANSGKSEFSNLLSEQYWSEEGQQSVAVEPFWCSECNLIFPSAKVMRAHLIEKHMSPTEHSNKIVPDFELSGGWIPVLTEEEAGLPSALNGSSEIVQVVESTGHDYGCSNSSPQHSVDANAQISQNPAPQNNFDNSRMQRDRENTDSDGHATSVTSGFYRCCICPTVFTEKSDLFLHTSNVHNKTTLYECNICKRVFLQRMALTKHMNTHKSSHLSTVEGFECHICGKQFLYQSYLRRHVATHTGDSIYGCNFCGKEFRSQRSLVFHRSLHTGEKNHECPKCKKKFAYKCYLERHIKTHSLQEKSLKCSMCSAQFKVPSMLEKHIVLNHKRENLLTCPICEKKFQYSAYLDRHLLFHTKTKEHKCPICHKLYTFRSSLLEHLKNHLPSESATQEAKRYTCQYCISPKSYVHESTLELHMRTNHSDISREELEKTSASIISEEDSDEDLDLGLLERFLDMSSGQVNEERLESAEFAAGTSASIESETGVMEDQRATVVTTPVKVVMIM